LSNLGGYNRIFPIESTPKKEERENLSPRLAQIFSETIKKEATLITRPSLFPVHIQEKATAYYARFY
jgi:hypothetical protein